MAHSHDEIRASLKKHQHTLLAKTNVVATGIGYKVTAGKRTNELGIVCSVSQKLPASKLSTQDMVPGIIDAMPVDVVETGPIRALQSRTDRQRPAPGGVSIGHRDITAGTLGCVVRKNGERVILSNNHVLANSNVASIGDPILQPGPVDGGKLSTDQIATLLNFVPIQFPDTSSDCNIARGLSSVANAIAGAVGSNTRLQAVKTQTQANLVDAAIAAPLNDHDISDAIIDIGEIQGQAQGELGMAIKKSGRTTGFTQGEILQTDVTVNVQYGANQIATFSDQLLAGAMSQGGDSGSAVLTENNRLVGLLFAGSDSNTIINRIEHVFSLLEVSL